MKIRDVLILTGWIALAVVARLVPHPANFSPLTAMAVFSGAVATPLFGRQAWLAWSALLIAMLISDSILGFYPSAIFVYSGFVAAIACGQWFNAEIGARQTRTYALGALTATVSGATIFFVLSNLGVWAEGQLYPLTSAGFMACYFAAIPFFVKSLSGDLFFALAFFGLWASVRQSVLIINGVRAPAEAKQNFARSEQ